MAKTIAWSIISAVVASIVTGFMVASMMPKKKEIQYVTSDDAPVIVQPNYHEAAQGILRELDALASNADRAFLYEMSSRIKSGPQLTPAEVNAVAKSHYAKILMPRLVEAFPRYQCDANDLAAYFKMSNDEAIAIYCDPVYQPLLMIAKKRMESGQPITTDVGKRISEKYPQLTARLVSYLENDGK